MEETALENYYGLKSPRFCCVIYYNFPHQTKYCTQQEIPLSPQSVIIHERKSCKLEKVGRQTADHQTATFELEQRGWHLNRLNDHRQCTQPLARCRLRVWWWNLQISSHCATTRARLCLPQTCSNPHRHARTTAVTTTFSQCYACFAVGCCAKHSGLRNSRMCGSVQPTHNTSNSLLKKIKASPYSTTERSVPQLIPVLGSQPAGDES